MDEKLIQTSDSAKGGKSGIALYVFILLSLLILVGGALGGFYIFMKETGKIVDKGAALLDILSSKNSFRQTLGPIVSDKRFQRLQFSQRDQVCLFRIVRYWGKDDKAGDKVEYYKKESDKTKLSSLPIWMNRYCEWEAKGTYEFNFYIDMSDLSKWDYEWNSASNTLTFYPQCEVEANTPAELEPLVYTCLASSIGVNSAAAKETLINALPEQKVKLAQDQKQFMIPEAKAAIAKHYESMFKMIPNVRIERFPDIKVVFPHERTPSIPKKL